MRRRAWLVFPFHPFAKLGFFFSGKSKNNLSFFLCSGSFADGCARVVFSQCVILSPPENLEDSLLG